MPAALRLLHLLTLLLLALAAPGAAWAQEGALKPSADYRVGEGDVLFVSVYGEDDMSGSFTVGAGGVLNYPIAKDVVVTGLTAAQIAERLTERLDRDILEDPRVSVKVEACISQQVDVLGAVNAPGEFYLCGTTSLLDILARAGGVQDESVTEIWLKRGDEPERKISYEALLDRTEENPVLQAEDRVYVPAGLVVYVTGEVREPGSVPYRRDITFTQALSEAGGLTPTAKLRVAYLLRDGQRQTVRLRRLLRGAGGVEDPVLMPNDQIIIEESSF